MYRPATGHAMLQVREFERPIAFDMSCLDRSVTETVRGQSAFLTSGGPHHELALYPRGADALAPGVLAGGQICQPISGNAW